MPTQTINACLRRVPGFRPVVSTRVLRLVVLAVLLLTLCFSGSWLGGEMQFRIGPRPGGVDDWTIIVTLLAYMLATAIPFVPGIEIGLLLMLVLGREGIVLVYLATQVSLVASFLAGRMLPPQALVALFGWLQLERARDLVADIGAMPPVERMAALTARVPPNVVGPFVRHPCIALGLALNLPGNGLIGGAGGIAMIAGLSYALPIRCYLLLVAVATTPVPVFLLVFGVA